MLSIHCSQIWPPACATCLCNGKWRLQKACSLYLDGSWALSVSVSCYPDKMGGGGETPISRSHIYRTVPRWVLDYSQTCEHQLLTWSSHAFGHFPNVNWRVAKMQIPQCKFNKHYIQVCNQSITKKGAAEDIPALPHENPAEAGALLSSIEIWQSALSFQHGF